MYFKAKWRETNGYSEGKSENKRVSVTYDKETFNKIKSLSELSGDTFAQTVRQLVKKGLSI